MLIIPNTTTVATEQATGFASFPPDQGALTPFIGGYLFVANNSAQISIRKGPSAPGAWTPYALVSPTLVPLSTDRGGRKTPDFIFGVKAIDAVAGTHAQIFGALFQPGEAGFVPSAQFGGTISPTGGFGPGVAPVNGITDRVDATGTLISGTGYAVSRTGGGAPTGDYTVTYTTPFSVTPDLLASCIITSPAQPFLSAQSVNGFRCQTLNPSTLANVDQAFAFLALAIQ